MIHALRTWSMLGPMRGNGADDWLPDGERIRLATGRMCIAHLIRSLDMSGKDTVMMPAYIAAGVINPFRKAGVTVVHYRLDEYLAPDQQHVRELLAEHPGVAMFVLPRLFGFQPPIGDLTDLLRDRGIWLLDDCAHALLGKLPDGRPLGSDADFALFSLNKFLAVGDGAVLVNRTGRSLAITDSLMDLPAAVQGAYEYHLRLNAALSEAVSYRCDSLLARSAEAYENYYRYIDGAEFIELQSVQSYRVECSVDFEAMTAQRRQNARHLYENPVPGVRFVNTLAAGVVPFAVPVIVPAGRRDAILEEMRGGDVLPAVQFDKWNFLPDGPDFPVERDFMANHLLLPVNETLGLDEMDRVIDALRSAVFW